MSLLKISLGLTAVRVVYLKLTLRSIIMLNSLCTTVVYSNSDKKWVSFYSVDNECMDFLCLIVKIKVLYFEIAYKTIKSFVTTAFYPVTFDIEFFTANEPMT